MPTVQETIDTLKEMGFPEDRCKLALDKTNWKGVEAAMEWLLSHSVGEGDCEKDDDDNGDDKEVAVETASTTRVLTEEEKAERLARLEELRVKKRLEREEREKREALEREKKRIQDGKEMSLIKQQMEDNEMLRLAAERKREKMETLRAKERVKAQIEADKRARKERDARDQGLVAPAQPQVSSAPAVCHNAPKCYEEARLQIRQPDGQAIIQSFKAKEPLSAVRLYAEMNRRDSPGAPVKLMTNFPKRIFLDEDYEQPLEALGLVPSAVVLICN